MPRLYIARRAKRMGLFLPMQRTGKNPALMFFLPKMDRGQLDELVRAQLEKQGVTKESDVQALVDKAEVEYELRRKVEEADKEVRRLMKLREAGARLMQVGWRKWKEAFFPAIRKGK